MTDIPNEAIARRIEYPMQRDSELNDTQSCAEMPAGNGNSVNRFLAQFSGELDEIAFRQFA